jgi:hypothetical protein
MTSNALDFPHGGSLSMPLGQAQIAGMATAVPPITATVDEVWDALGRARGRRMPKLQGDRKSVV